MITRAHPAPIGAILEVTEHLLRRRGQRVTRTGQAALLGADLPSLSSWAAGSRAPTVATVERLIGALATAAGGATTLRYWSGEGWVVVVSGDDPPKYVVACGDEEQSRHMSYREAAEAAEELGPGTSIWDADVFGWRTQGEPIFQVPPGQ